MTLGYDYDQRAYRINGASVAAVLALAGDNPHWYFDYGDCGSHDVLLRTETPIERRKRLEEERIARFEEEKRVARSRHIPIHY